MRRVVILYKYVPQYRAAFFDRLRNRLAAVNIDLRLVYGQPGPEDATKGDAVEVPWGRRIRNRSFVLAGRRLYWQPTLGWLLRNADLVIVEQASKLLVNYPLLAAQMLGGPRLALWGHGRNYQRHNASVPGEKVKAVVSRLPHWWFAYTTETASVVTAGGYPETRITIVQNAIETETLVELAAALGPDKLKRFREEHRIRSPNVALFIGGMYEEKRLPFLITAAHLVRRSVPDLELLLVGAGPTQAIAADAASSHPWIHYAGPLFGADKAAAFGVANVLMMPGLVGLAVLDAFAFTTPIVTTRVDYHSPEVAYIDDGYNGIITPDDLPQYAAAVADVVRDTALRERLEEGCRHSAGRYTLENMTENFAQGVEAALAVAR